MLQFNSKEIFNKKLLLSVDECNYFVKKITE